MTRQRERKRQPRLSRAERERARFKQDILLLSGLIGGFLIAGIGLFFAIHDPTSNLLIAITALGLIVGLASGLVIHFQRYKCPKCGGRLKPIARPEDRRVGIGEDGEPRMISQFFDCNDCGHREWIEND